MPKSTGKMNGGINALSIENAAYIAGIIDADGAVTSSMNEKTRRFPAPLVIITNGDTELINWLKMTIGAGTSYLTKTRPKWHGQNMANWNPVHRYQITGWKAISLLEVILPYMRVKRDRAELVVQMPVRLRDYGFKCPDHLIEKSYRLHAEIRRLNKRGVRDLSNAA